MTTALAGVVGTGLGGLIGALLGYALGEIGPLGLTMSLGFASSAMLYVVFGEILAQSILMYHSKLPAFSTIAGILLGMLIIFLTQHPRLYSRGFFFAQIFTDGKRPRSVWGMNLAACMRTRKSGMEANCRQ